MTDMRLSKEVKRELVQVNEVRMGDVLDLIDCE